MYETVVTTNRRKDRLLDVPAAVTVVNRKRIEEEQPAGVPDLLRGVPGILVNDYYGVGRSYRLSLRGFSPYGSRRVLVLVDGVPMNEGDDGDVSWELLPPPNAVERVEVMRGAASALYGGHAMGGVINIITRRGSPKLRVVLGSRFQSAGWGMAYWALVSGSHGQGKGYGKKNIFLYRLFAGYRMGDGFRDHSDYRQVSTGIRLGAKLKDGSSLDFRFSLVDSFGNAAGALTGDEYLNDRTQSVRPYDSNQYRIFTYATTYSRPTGKVGKLQATVFGFHKSYDIYMDYWGVSEYVSDANRVGLNALYDLTLPVFGRANSLLIGVSSLFDHILYRSYAAPERVRGELKTDQRTEILTLAAYIQDRLEVWGPLSVTLGLRLDATHHDLLDYLDSSKTGKRWMYEVSPTIGVHCKAGRHAALYASAGRVFMAPTPQQLFASSYANPDLDPERAWIFEVGGRGRLLGSIDLAMTLFWIEMSNEIVRVSEQGDTLYENTGKTRHIGMELELAVRLPSGLKPYLSYTVQYASFVDYSRYDSQSGENVSYNGNRLPYCSWNTLSAGLAYLSRFGLSARIWVNIMSSQFIDTANTAHTVIPVWHRLNARVAYTWRWFRIYAGVNNMTNTKYYEMRTSAGIYPAPGVVFLGGLVATL